MGSKPEVIKMMVEVSLVDADGTPIREGSVLRNLDDNETGVVVKIMRSGDRGPMFSGVGDLQIKLSRGVDRITNRYSRWVHVSHDAQTYEQRLLAWRQVPYDKEQYLSTAREQLSDSENLAIDGIMNLLPSNTVNWDNGPWPDDLDVALQLLAEHLTELKSKTKETRCT
jgi:hypothetical protein